MRGLHSVFGGLEAGGGGDKRIKEAGKMANDVVVPQSTECYRDVNLILRSDDVPVFRWWCFVCVCVLLLAEVLKESGWGLKQGHVGIVTC